jgi:hypothetical protein
VNDVAPHAPGVRGEHFFGKPLSGSRHHGRLIFERRIRLAFAVSRLLRRLFGRPRFQYLQDDLTVR